MEGNRDGNKSLERGVFILELSCILWGLLENNLFSMVNVMSWNARGIGRKEKRGQFRKILRDNKIDFLMLQESKKLEMKENIIRSFCGLRSMEFSEVDADGLSRV